jgi:hypothetical protein
LLQETFRYGDILLRRRCVYRRFVWRRFVEETFCMCAKNLSVLKSITDLLHLYTDSAQCKTHSWAQLPLYGVKCLLKDILICFIQFSFFKSTLNRMKPPVLYEYIRRRIALRLKLHQNDPAPCSSGYQTQIEDQFHFTKMRAMCQGILPYMPQSGKSKPSRSKIR